MVEHQGVRWLDFEESHYFEEEMFLGLGGEEGSLVEEQFEELHGEDEVRVGGRGGGRDEQFFEEPLLIFDLLHCD